jgi:hypothetical protein
MFQHGQAQLSMWHVWWHIGLRQYGAMQQQQQQQQGLRGTKVKASSTSSSSSSFEDGSGIDALYLDPEAR